ncbi:hypothetical protein [Streptomyces sp. 7N604]|uniref:hypothetical protein n=1 Tax=Streptomyces sp. 7N604 TaxID=3457415 RepID=UPI003FCF33EB
MTELRAPQTATATDEPDEACDWLVEDYDEDGPTTRDCGARVHHTDTGWCCERGHSHTYAEHRHAQGWDYCDDAIEAARLAQVGVIGVRPGDSRPWL